MPGRWCMIGACARRLKPGSDQCPDERRSRAFHLHQTIDLVFVVPADLLFLDFVPIAALRQGTRWHAPAGSESHEWHLIVAHEGPEGFFISHISHLFLLEVSPFTLYSSHSLPEHATARYCYSTCINLSS
jgi:hypothetical protein